MLRRGLLAVAAAAALVLVPAAGAAAHEPRLPGHSCGHIEFAPRSDFIASHIKAVGVSCRRAREVVRARIKHGVRRPFGYRCTLRRDDDGLFHSHYRCAKGGAVVRWTQT